MGLVDQVAPAFLIKVSPVCLAVPMAQEVPMVQAVRAALVVQEVLIAETVVELAHLVSPMVQEAQEAQAVLAD